jgi:hypothetical protein
MSPSQTPIAAVPSDAILKVASTAAALAAACPITSDDVALYNATAAGCQLSPSLSRSGSSSSVLEMSGAEDGGSETDSIHLPRRQRKRSPQSHSKCSL